MAYSNDLLEEGREIWEAQMEHPFVRELAEGTLDVDVFRFWVRQDYLYLVDYARAFAIAGATARREETMTELMTIAQSTLDTEMDLHRKFAASYGISHKDLEETRKAPTCQAYTDFLIRTAYEGSLAEISAALFPCGQGFLDVGEHAEVLSPGEHRYTPWIEMYTSDEFREVVNLQRNWVDRCAQRFPGKRDAMREAFLTSARLEYQFWEMAYLQEEWGI